MGPEPENVSHPPVHSCQVSKKSDHVCRNSLIENFPVWGEMVQCPGSVLRGPRTPARWSRDIGAFSLRGKSFQCKNFNKLVWIFLKFGGSVPAGETNLFSQPRLSISSPVGVGGGRKTRNGGFSPLKLIWTQFSTTRIAEMVLVSRDDR